MIDFSNLPVRKKAYGGANGSKLAIIYDDSLYMLKLPMRAWKNPIFRTLTAAFPNTSAVIFSTCWG